MKSFAVFIVLVAAIAQVHSMEGEKSTEGTNIRQNEQQMRQMGPIPQMNMQMAPKEDLQMRNKAEPSTEMVGSAYGKPAYGGGYGAAYPSVPAPPCPRNYLFSCQPNLTPAPCAQQAASYGSAGAYSQYVPQYALPAPFRY